MATIINDVKSKTHIMRLVIMALALSVNKTKYWNRQNGKEVTGRKRHHWFMQSTLMSNEKQDKVKKIQYQLIQKGSKTMLENLYLGPGRD